MRRLVSALALAALAFPTNGTAQAAVAVSPIQPGAGISTPIGGCTLNFVYRDGEGTIYVGTAGHCTNLGDRITANGIGQFGTTVFSQNQFPVLDFALIEVDPEDLDKVNPQMRYWGGPTGVVEYQEAKRGDLVAVYGYGLGFGSTEYTRRRAGVIQTTTVATWNATVPVIFGDSGGPAIHLATGKALGVIDVLGAGPSTGAGTLISRVLFRLRQFPRWADIELVTAPLEPFPPAP